MSEFFARCLEEEATEDMERPEEEQRISKLMHVLSIASSMDDDLDSSHVSMDWGNIIDA